MNNENPNMVPNLGPITPVPNNAEPQNNDVPELAPTINPLEVSSVSTTPEVLTPVTSAPVTSAPETTPVVPVTTPVVPTTAAPAVVAPSVSGQATRYNPVTGEEMNMSELKGEAPVETLEEGAVNNEEKLKTVEVNYKPTSTANTVVLICFFAALIAFVIFLPDIQNLIALYKAGPVEVEEITTGRLVCTLDTSTTNLDRNITRIFEFTDNKLQSAKFTTIVRGDATLDEETLNEYNAQCEMIKENVKGLSGISVNCTYENGKLTEKENYDYASYNPEEVSAAYTEAGGTMMEYQQGEEIDLIMTNMRQSGFTCNKEK